MDVNIAILISSLTGGGAERVSQIVGDYYFEKGENVYYFLMDMSMKQDYDVKGHIIHTGIKSSSENVLYGDIEVLGRLLKSSWEMRKWKKKYKIDIAISFLEEPNYLNILSKGKEKVITRVCTILSKWGEMKGLLHNKHFIHLLYSLSDTVVVMGNYGMYDTHKTYGISRKKIQRIPNPAIQRPKTEDVWVYGNKAVICIGRLDSVKQQDRIIRAFSYVKMKHKEAKLLILGDGPMKAYLEKLCIRYQLRDSVIFIGFTQNVSFYFGHSKVFVMASKVEGFPNSMVEAMACGVPVVAADCPGECRGILGKKYNNHCNGEIEYCTYGILTPAITGRVMISSELTKEELLLGTALERVIEDRELYEKYRERSLKRASKYNMEMVMGLWDKIVTK